MCPTDDGPFKGLGIDCRVRGVTVDKGGPIDKLLGVGRSFTAHPHVLGDNTMAAFKSTSNAKKDQTELEFIVYDHQWNEISSTEYDFPKGPPPHDFLVTENYFVFFENPFGAMDKLPYLFGLKSPTQIMQLLLEMPCVLHLVPRSPEVKPLKVNVPPYFNIHMAKADEKDGKLYIYSNGWDLKDRRFFPSTKKSVPFLGSWGGLFPDFLGGIVPPSYFYRTVVDLKSKQAIIHDEVSPGLVMEFPAQSNHDPSIIYCSVASTDYTSMPGTGLCKVNVETSTVQLWWAENKIFTHEITPVPKRNGQIGDWLLTMLYDAGNRRATLAIFDSENFAAGPICRLHLKHNLTYGLHGSFSPPSINRK